MNKAGAPSGGGGAGSGPTANSAAAAAQKQRSLLQRLDNDISNIVDSFSLLVSVSRVNEPPVRNSQETFLMDIRATKLVQSADSLIKLVADLKQTAIFSGFASLNEYVECRMEAFDKEAETTEKLLQKIGEEAAASLKELESHYYSSVERNFVHE